LQRCPFFSAIIRLRFVALYHSDNAQAAAHFAASLEIYRGYGNQVDMPKCLAGLAAVACTQGQPERAARLFGAMEALFEVTEARFEDYDLTERADCERSIATVRDQLDEATFAATWVEGRAMTLEHAITYALSEPDSTVRTQAVARCSGGNRR
jgi:hypothetical protein